MVVAAKNKRIIYERGINTGKKRRLRNSQIVIYD